MKRYQHVFCDSCSGQFQLIWDGLNSFFSLWNNWILTWVKWHALALHFPPRLKGHIQNSSLNSLLLISTSWRNLWSWYFNFSPTRVFPRENLVGGYRFTPPSSMFSGGVKYAVIFMGGTAYFWSHMGGYTVNHLKQQEAMTKGLRLCLPIIVSILLDSGCAGCSSKMKVII